MQYYKCKYLLLKLNMQFSKHTVCVNKVKYSKLVVKYGKSEEIPIIPEIIKIHKIISCENMFSLRIATLTEKVKI